MDTKQAAAEAMMAMRSCALTDSDDKFFKSLSKKHGPAIEAGMAEMADNGASWTGDSISDIVEIEWPAMLCEVPGFEKTKAAIDAMWDDWLAGPAAVAPGAQAQSAGDGPSTGPDYAPM